MYKEGVRSSC